MIRSKNNTHVTPLAWLASLVVLLSLTALPSTAQAQQWCKKCHSKAGMNQKLVDPARHLNVALPPLKKSVHKDNDCTDCHDQLSNAKEGQKHKTPVGLPNCANCHEKQAKIYKGSVHGKALAKGKKGMAYCGDCHGAHDIVKVKDPRSRVYKMRLPFTCANCHNNPKLAKAHNIKLPKAARHYMDSIHGRGLLKAGLIVAPGCTDCHGSHDIQRDSDPRSPIHWNNVPNTCGKCHVGISKIYDQSVHGQLHTKYKKQGMKRRGPVCIDCHTSHKIIKPTRGMFKLASDESCGKCHKDRLKRYRETYHGKAIALGSKNVAACYDCHGHHDVLPHTNPKSHLSKQNKLKTCQKCHPRASEGFTGYLAHGDHADKKNYPKLYWTYLLMTMLLLGVFGFFGIHTLLWFVRSVVLLIRNPKAFREAREKVREEKEGKLFVRFRPVDRFCHFLVIISFLLLTITGMPLKFYYTGWARWLLDGMGGPAVAAWLHRLGAFLTLLYFVIHIVSLIGPLWRARPEFQNDKGRFSFRRLLGFLFGPDTPVPNLQDFKDFWAHQKWFFGRGPRPQFDRWTYWEKFDYLAVFWGVAIIGLSGVVMWIPETVTTVFPGWIINVAHVIHSDEALLAAGFIFTFHFFNVHFRIEKFPMDPVIFSGRITEEEMLHERKRLYDRLEAAGKLNQERVQDEWPRWRRIFVPIGMLAFTVGVALIILIYWAMASRLFPG
ncbi:MAG: hypothetical protein ABI333_01525 [bacterium]